MQATSDEPESSVDFTSPPAQKKRPADTRDGLFFSLGRCAVQTAHGELLQRIIKIEEVITAVTFLRRLPLLSKPPRFRSRARGDSALSARYVFSGRRDEHVRVDCWGGDESLRVDRLSRRTPP